ncbi:MAG: hypothetical protein HQL44_17165 [Alphaproteobacteria bacterium]|nr:hypothetical protein [Alphaproteobacteria bacterium]
MSAMIASAHGRAFEWGSFDCCLWACDVVEALTGVDPAAPFRGRYKSKRGAFVALKRFAGGGMLETARKIADDLSCPEVPVKTARRGDVVLLERDDGPALGVCVGKDVAAASLTGLCLVPLKEASHAWRVG